MSATDSDNSIDWLASDYEDNESEQEFDSSRKHSQTEAPPSHGTPAHLGASDDCCQVKSCDSNWSEVREASGRGSPPGYTETWDNTIGLLKGQHGEKTNPLQALKRRRASLEEESKEQQLLSNVSEKNRIFSRKVSASSTKCLIVTRGG